MAKVYNENLLNKLQNPDDFRFRSIVIRITFHPKICVVCVETSKGVGTQAGYLSSRARGRRIRSPFPMSGVVLVRTLTAGHTRAAVEGAGVSAADACYGNRETCTFSDAFRLRSCIQVISYPKDSEQLF